MASFNPHTFPGHTLVILGAFGVLGALVPALSAQSSDQYYIVPTDVTITPQINTDTYYGFNEFVRANPSLPGPPPKYAKVTWKGEVTEFRSGPDNIGGSKTIFGGADTWSGATEQNNLSSVSYINLGSTSPGDGSNGPYTVIGSPNGGCSVQFDGKNVTVTTQGTFGGIGLTGIDTAPAATTLIRYFSGAVSWNWARLYLPCALESYYAPSTDFPETGPVSETLSQLVTTPVHSATGNNAQIIPIGEDGGFQVPYSVQSTASVTWKYSDESTTWVAGAATPALVVENVINFEANFPPGSPCLGNDPQVVLIVTASSGSGAIGTFAVQSTAQVVQNVDGSSKVTGSLSARPIELNGNMLCGFPQGTFTTAINYTQVVSLNKVLLAPRTGGCALASCQSDHTGSIHWSMGLGPLNNGDSAGLLSLDTEVFTAAVYTPSSLVFSRQLGINSNVSMVRRADYSPRQISTGNWIFDIVTAAEDSTLAASVFEIRTYLQAGSSPSSAVPALLVPAGAALQRTRFSDPDGNGNRLLIERFTSGSQPFSSVEYSFNSTTNTWSLIEQGLRRTDKTIVVQADGSEQVTTTVWDLAQSAPLMNSKTVERFSYITSADLGHGSLTVRALTSRIIDPDGAALLSQWQYGQPNSGQSGRLLSYQSYTGSWEKYDTHMDGYTIVSTATTPVGNTGFNDASGSTRVIARSATPDYTGTQTVTSDSLSGLWKDMWQQLPDLAQRNGQNYLVSRLSRSLNGPIDQTTPGIIWEINQTYADGPFIGRQAYHLDRVGVLELTAYSLDPATNRTTQTVDHGAPSGDGSSVVDGTHTVTVTNPDGQLFSQTVSDITSGLTTASQTVVAWDAQGRPTSIALPDGSLEQRSYSECCGLLESDTVHGVTTTYSYDALRRKYSETASGISTVYAYDALNRVVKTTRVGIDGSQTVLSTTTYDTAGRVTATTNALGAVTTYSETYNTDGTTTRTTTAPDNSTVVTVTNRDGTLQSRSGTQTTPANYTYATGTYASLPVMVTTENKALPGATATEWAKTSTDALGRTRLVQYPDGGVRTSQYNDQDQLVAQADPDGVTTLFGYNAKNELETQAIDMDHNGQIDSNGTDRITRNHRDVTTDHGTTVQRTTTTVWTTGGGAATQDVAVSEISADGLQSWQTTYGLPTAAQIVYNTDGSRTQTTTVPDGTTSVQSYINNRLTSSVTSNAATGTLASTTYAYDPQGRVQSATDARNGATLYTYFNDDQVNTVTTPDPDPSRSGAGYDPQTTTYAYDNMGRVTQVTQPDGGQVNTTYWPTGAVRRTWGARTYPVEYAYDLQGRVKTLTIWQDFAGQAGSAVTTWNYDPQRGWLTSKTDAAGRSVAYTHTPAGRMLTRNWARETARGTTYTHDAAGNVNSITYSDQTPVVVFGYDRLGRLSTRSDAAGSCTYAYQGATSLPTGESFSGGPLDGLSVARGYDTLLRLSGVMALNSQPSTINLVSYAYDGASRLSTVTQGTSSAIYSFLPNSSLVGSIGFQQGGVSKLGTTMAYDYLNRLTSIGSQLAGPGSALSAAYTYNSANQRTQVVREDSSYWNYGYDALGQVTSGNKFDATATAVLGHAFAYSFDDIGNRKSTTANGQAATYSPNSLNQYTQRTVPGVAELLGAADAAAVVTANASSVSRQGELFYRQLPVDNSSAKYLAVAVHAVRAGAGPGGADVAVDETRHALVAATPEAFTYDADGNLTADGKWTYEWDAENRLSAMQTTPAAVSAGAPKRRLVFSYDGMGRRIAKRVLGWDATANAWGVQASRVFLYDGWNLLAELDATNSNAVVGTFAWGLDLSGSVQGAGGVGGLLFSTFNAPLSTYASAFDGNGNIIGLVDMATGLQAATYEYGAFGEMLTSSGVAATLNHFGFSTKYTDVETGLLYYGLRYYSPSTGRWINRDLIQESGGLNLMSFLNNDAVQGIDPWGLKESRKVPGGTLEWNLRRRMDADIPVKLEISFIPDSTTCACKHIDFVQVVIQNKVGGEPIHGPGGDDSYLPLSGGFDGGLRVDRLPADTDPFYSGKRDPQLGWVASRRGWVVGNGPSGRPAVASDAPTAGREARMSRGDRRLRFETFAVCIDTGVIYGGVRWGIDIEDRPDSPARLSSDFLSKPSIAWRLAVGKWNEIAPDRNWDTFNTWASP